MRILVIGDHESKSLWDFYEPSKLEDIDRQLGLKRLQAIAGIERKRVSIPAEHNVRPARRQCPGLPCLLKGQPSR